MMPHAHAKDLLKEIHVPPCSSSQFFHACTDEGQPDTDPVGRTIPNVASEAIVSGEAVYIDDIPTIQGELFLSLVLSTKAHANILSVDPSEALEVDGVNGFIDHTNIQGTNRFGFLKDDEEFFATKEVVYYGQPIGAVLADSREISHRAATLVKIEYENLDHILSIEEAVEAGSYLADPIQLDHGDAKKGFEQSTRVVDGDYRTGFQEHFYMETQSILVIPRHENDEMEVFCATQGLTNVQGTISRLLNIPRSKITCKTKRVGGAFGGKEGREFVIAGPAAIAAHTTQRPVRCVLPRDTDMLLTGKRHPVIANYKVGIDESGHIKALDIRLFFNGGCSMDLTSLIREINLIKEGHITSCDQRLTNVTVGDMWSDCMASSDFDYRRQDIDNYNKSNRWRKRGLAMTTVRFGIGSEVSSFNQGAALVNIYLDGSVLLSHGGIEVGQGLNTKLIQVAARILGVPMEKIHVVEASTAAVPNTVVTCGSFATDIFAPAVMNACSVLMERLDPLKSKYPNACWELLIRYAYEERIQLSATGFHRPTAVGASDRRVGWPTKYVTYGIVCSEVEADVLTGENQVLRSDIIFDVGKSLNPAIDIGQIEGAFVQGLGMVTSEFMDVDEDGRLTNCSPLSYKIPNIRSIPRKLNITLLKNHNIKTVVYSSKGIGEPALLGSVSVIMAIKDAVQAARAQIGIHGYFRLDSPATVQRIREACGDQLSILKT